ncbi:bis-aminopropyl spermidine synthase family protein [Kribbella sp. NPDC051620]|uniref:bis-aminopropyl spermidine synthase family protein n=1 Tax=Kribbella sp. NPDC051620 TaxID=3364120 RepID=UPI00379E2AAB
MQNDDLTTAKSPEPIDLVAAHLAEFGAHARSHRQVLAVLADGNTSLDVLVRESALPRRVVEALLRQLGDDLLSSNDVLSIRPSRIGVYRQRFALDQLHQTHLLDPADDRLDGSDDLVKLMADIIAAGPKPVRALDHVPATPTTAVRRALWMDGSFDLAGSTLLCIGDHDLTSIATCLVNPKVKAIVVDIDENLLSFIDKEASRRGLNIQTAYADFRLGIPSIALESADLVFTDPPYTPEGVRLFLARGLQGLRDRANGRLLMAYGYGSHQPTLGLKVQQAVQSLSIVYEAILPHFNRYVGAQAVGSASDLYVCRPTTVTWKALDRTASDAVNIYTHGAQSLEGEKQQLSDMLNAALIEAAAGPGDLPVSALIGMERPKTDGEMVGLSLSEIFDGTGLASIKNARTSAAAVDLFGDPGSWLTRTLVGLNVQRLAISVHNKHPDITSQVSQEALRDLVGSKWRLRFRRSTPDSTHAIIEGTEVDVAGLTPRLAAQRYVLDGAHRKLENAWRDALVKASRRLDGVPLTKNQARERIADTGVAPETLAGSLIELPEHQIRSVLIYVAASLTAVAE